MIQKVKDLFRRRTHDLRGDPDEFEDAVLSFAYRATLAQRTVSAWAIAQEMDVPDEVIFDTLQGLADEECLDVRVMRGDHGPMDAMVTRVLPEGLRRLGVWPQ